MPMYTYKCTSCAWSGDRISSLAKRDSQHCGAFLEKREVKAFLRESVEHVMCGALLAREELSGVHAALPLQWKVK